MDIRAIAAVVAKAAWDTGRVGARDVKTIELAAIDAIRAAQAVPVQPSLPQPSTVLAYLRGKWGKEKITVEVTQAVEETIDYIENKRAGQRKCPKCGNDYPHLLTDGSWYCDECGHRWAGQ